MVSIRVACIAGLLLMATPAAAQAPVPPVLPLLSLTDGQLFPGLSMEVQIIEQSSRVMVDEAVKGNSIIGVVTLRPGGVPNERGRSPIFDTGNVCIIDDVMRQPDGRLFILIRSVMTFRLDQELTDRVYRSARVTTRSETVADGDRELLGSLRRRADELSAIADPVRPAAMSDTDRINRLAFYMDLDPFERQAILDRDSIVARAQALVDLLTMKLATRR